MKPGTSKIKLLLKLLLLITCAVAIFIFGVFSGRNAQIYRDAPFDAWLQLNHIKQILDDKKREPDCSIELHLSLEIIQYFRGDQSWERFLLVERLMGYEFAHQTFLKKLRDYRNKYPLSESYFEPCKEYKPYYDGARARIEEAWNYVMTHADTGNYELLPLDKDE